MLWVGWRQQRAETVIAAALLAVLAAVLVPTGLHIAAAYDSGHLADCLGRTQSGSCPDAIGSFVNRFNHLGDLLAWLTILPGIIGLLLAAPLISQLEHNTHRLDWTQSITRRRWLAGKLGLALATAVVAAAVMTLLTTWWRAPIVHFQGRVTNSAYDSEGTVVSAYAVFALGLGAAIGAVWRRAAPSFVAAFAGYFAVRVFFDEVVRRHLVKPVSATFAFKRGGPDLNTAWILQQTPLGGNGKALQFLSCPHNAGGPCKIPAPAFSAMHVVYHPASHFWALQIRETALFALAGLALLGFAAWWTARA